MLFEELAPRLSGESGVEVQKRTDESAREHVPFGTFGDRSRASTILAVIKWELQRS
jgi:hypothetical protein